MEHALVVVIVLVVSGVLLWIILRMETNRMKTFVKILQQVDQTMKLLSTRYERHKNPRGYYRYHFRVEKDGQEKILSLGEKGKNALLSKLQDGDEFIMNRNGEEITVVKV